MFSPGSAFIIIYYLFSTFKLFCLSSQEAEILAYDWANQRNHYY